MNPAGMADHERRSRTADRRFPTPAAWLRLGIQEARSWEELTELCTCIDAAYQSGELEQAIAEELAGLTAEIARLLPEADLGPESVQVEELLDRTGDRCPCCGRVSWWKKATQQVCAVCHPDPRWERRERTAA